jgi:cell shape-determining protein MreC
MESRLEALTELERVTRERDTLRKLLTYYIKRVQELEQVEKEQDILLRQFRQVSYKGNTR